jgi:Cu2+-exporting ATPase
VPDGAEHAVRIEGRIEPMCCGGCEAVAKAIVDNGLADYYRHRDAMAEPQREAMPDVLRDLGLFDHPDFQKGFVSAVGEHEREAALILEGITCAACVWLNEQHVSHQLGVTAVDINYATRRMRVRWDERLIHLSGILGAIAAIGYRAHPYDPQRSEQLAKAERRAALWRLFVAGFGMMQVMMYAVPVYMADDGSMAPDIEQLMRWASLVLTLPVVLYSSAPFFRSAWRDLKLRRVGMDVPVAIGVGSAFLASAWATLRGGGEVYFDSVTMFVFFLLSGRYLELVARQSSVRGVERLTRVLPAFAAKLPRFPEMEVERVALSTLEAGDAVLVKPGEVVPADGVVVQGCSTADESLLTGESLPVPKNPGSALTGGSLNVASPLVMRIEKVGEATRIAAIQRLMQRAATEKPRIVALADGIAGWFVSALVIVAFGAGIVWMSIDPSRALWIFVAVLVVSCPCALSLATPAALTVATGALAEIGLLVTRGHAIETLARATHFVFDKTGTLTLGRLRLERTHLLGDMDADTVTRVAAALEQGSEHAIGNSLHARLPEGTRLAVVDGLRTVAGQGVEGRVGGRLLRIGRSEFVAELHGQALPPAVMEAEGKTCVALGDTQGWLALFEFGDELRPQAGALVRFLQEEGIRVTILSGDMPSAVAFVAQSLGVADAHGGMSPQAKQEFIVALQAGGAVVAMAGDGVNDAPVLAQAQVSVAMGGGTELARAQGDLILLSDNLAALGSGIRLARRTLAVIRQNLLWAFLYNVLALPLAVFGYVTPWMAGIGMSASSLLVVLNALRLRRGKRCPHGLVTADARSGL